MRLSAEVRIWTRATLLPSRKAARLKWIRPYGNWKTAVTETRAMIFNSHVLWVMFSTRSSRNLPIVARCVGVKRRA